MKSDKQVGSRKVIYTLNINYSSEITDLTYPLLRHYAEKIDADFYVISDRKFPDWPMDYEKLQIHELAREQNREWIYYIDSDAVVHPDFFDVTNHIQKDTVMHNGADFANMRWKYDDYFRRDGRNIGSCNWFAIGSNWCIDLWEPLQDLTPEQAYANIYPTNKELHSEGSCREGKHLITDYVLSRNIAKYGFKFQTVNDLVKRLIPDSGFLWHMYDVSLDEKIKQMKGIIKKWNLEDYMPRELVMRWELEDALIHELSYTK